MLKNYQKFATCTDFSRQRVPVDPFEKGVGAEIFRKFCPPPILCEPFRALSCFFIGNLETNWNSIDGNHSLIVSPRADLRNINS